MRNEQIIKCRQKQFYLEKKRIYSKPFIEGDYADLLLVKLTMTVDNIYNIVPLFFWLYY